MAANPIISSVASLLVPWDPSRTVTCHCHKCDALLAIALNSWDSCDPYIFTRGSICVFDNNILSSPPSEPRPTEDGQYQSINCKNCLEAVGQGVLKEMFKDGYTQFNLFWSSHSIRLRDITTRELVPSRLDAVQSSLKIANPNNYESRNYQRQIDGPSGSKPSEGHPNTPSARATSGEMHAMINEWRHTISSLQDEIQCLKTTISSRNNTSQAPHDGYELIATALREVRAKGIEIEALKQENHSLRLKCSQLENMTLTRIEPIASLHSRPFVASPNIVGGALDSNQKRGHQLDLNSNGKRPLQEGISLFDAERSQCNPKGRNSSVNAGTQRPDNNSQPIRVVSNMTHHEGSKSDTDELAEPWQGPKYRTLSSNVNNGESNEKVPRTTPNQRQGHERNEASQDDPAKPSKKNATTKRPPGRPRMYPLSAKASTKKIPLKESDTNIQIATNSPGPTEPINQQAVESQTLDNPQTVNRSRRASARLSRRSSLAPPDKEDTQHSSSTEPNQVHAGPTPQLQGGDLQENPSVPTPSIQIPGKTIPNSQDDSDNPPLDQEDSRPIANEQEEGSQTTAKSTTLRHPTRGKFKSQIAARDSLAKLAMQREEALEMAAD
ncbi:hypothetical protein GX51_02699 [Blastomyces parvus]|uniref:Yippee domain-containing protein n=1 Tax=Blastomyces parvus TaxID=2060905 RepID=A0A2B7XB97_9EURO|nr:hypothetical protein GX51_02699 [Blastomyces parvus]